jgi:hypothetical protein
MTNDGSSNVFELGAQKNRNDLAKGATNYPYFNPYIGCNNYFLVLAQKHFSIKLLIFFSMGIGLFFSFFYIPPCNWHVEFLSIFLLCSITKSLAEYKRITSSNECC